jgi:hypothetical protein
MKLQSPTRASSIEGEQDQRSASHKASGFPKIKDTYDWFDAEAALAERPADFWTPHVKHRQEQDLSGLTLQASNNDILDNELETSKEVIEAIPQKQIRACPVHGALFAGLYGDTDLLPNPSQETGPMPIQRYVAEGLAERYALLSSNQTETGGEWARYSGCRCGVELIMTRSGV